MKKQKNSKKIELLISIVIAIIIAIASYYNIDLTEYIDLKSFSYSQKQELSFDLSSIPEFADEPYVILNENVPFFTEEELKMDTFELYSDLDELGRCGTAFALIGKETMPTEERGNISRIKPTGCQIKKYKGIDGLYFYNRCHLIGFQLAGENDNEKNLITGTRYLNVDGMLPFENQIAKYVDTTRKSCSI